MAHRALVVSQVIASPNTAWASDWSGSGPAPNPPPGVQTDREPAWARSCSGHRPERAIFRSYPENNKPERKGIVLRWRTKSRATAPMPGSEAGSRRSLDVVRAVERVKAGQPAPTGVMEVVLRRQAPPLELYQRRNPFHLETIPTRLLSLPPPQSAPSCVLAPPGRGNSLIRKIIIEDRPRHPGPPPA